MTPDAISTIISLLPPYLATISDLNNLLSTSHHIREITLAYLAPQHFLSILLRSPGILPNQDLLLYSLISHGLTQWLESEQNRALWYTTLPYSPDSILRLASVFPQIPVNAGFNLDKLQISHKRKKTETLVDELFDNCVGKAWYAIPDFWNGGRSDAVTLAAEPEDMVYLLAAYGEMFGPALDEWYAGMYKLQDADYRDAKIRQGTDAAGDFAVGNMNTQSRGHASLRMEWIKYSMPDWRVPNFADADAELFGLADYAETALGDVLESPMNPSHELLDWLKYGDAESGTRPSPSSTLVERLQTDISARNGVAEHNRASQDGSVPPTMQGASPTLRSVRREGVYADSRMKEEHISCFIHLFHRSPLFDRIATYIRQRAIRSALAGSSAPTVHISELTDNRPPGCEMPPDNSEEISDRHRETIKGEFGPRVHYASALTPWKQFLWEDAVYTGGWAGLELIADAWERDVENTKAEMRRQRRLEEQPQDPESRRISPTASTEHHQNQMRQSGVVEGEVHDVEIQEKGHAGEGTPKEMGRGWVEDTHPAYQRLAKIYLALHDLPTEPARITLKSKFRPGRPPVETYREVPFLLGDLHLAVWSPRMGQTWSIGR